MAADDPSGRQKAAAEHQGDVWRDADPGAPWPQGLEGLGPALGLARERGFAACVVTFPGDDDTKRQLAKRRHDVKAALRTLGFTVKALETGYRFDDDKAKAKIDAIAKAVQVLERESELLARVLAAD